MRRLAKEEKRALQMLLDYVYSDYLGMLADSLLDRNDDSYETVKQGAEVLKEVADDLGLRTSGFGDVLDLL